MVLQVALETFCVLYKHVIMMKLSNGFAKAPLTAELLYHTFSQAPVSMLVTLSMLNAIRLHLEHCKYP